MPGQEQRAGRKAVVAALAVVAVAAAVPASALAHGGPRSTSAHYLSTVDRITPPVPGLTVTVADRDDRLVMTNGSKHTVIVQGYSFEPYLRFDAKGVWQNMRSPSRWLDVERLPTAQLPSEADAKAPPEWKLVTPGRTWEWHDHRVQWMGAGNPSDTVKPVDGKIEVIQWEVPIQVDGVTSIVSGRLDYFVKAFGERGSGGGGSLGLVLAIVLPCAAALAAAAGWLLLRRRRRPLPGA